MPEISIVIAVLNGAETISKAIASAQNQTVHDIEIVVVNDGSTDATHDVVSALAADDSRIKYIRLQQNVGVGAARNMAMEHAAGEWIAILDADDWYETSRLQILLKTARNFEADLVADNLLIYDHIRRQVVDRTRHGSGHRVAVLTAQTFFERDNPFQQHPMGFLQPFIRRQFLIDHKIVYDPNHRVGEDFIFVAEMLLLGARALIVPGAHYTYVHRISPTTRKISPHSHSAVTAVFALMARGCSELLQKYGPSMTPQAREALLRRRKIFEKAAVYQDMRNALAQRQFLKAAGLMVAQPVVLLLAATIIKRWISANAQFYFGAPKYRSAGS